ncbi:MAG: metallophosphoesterase, partial [Myxococcota bacterium]|nr:metallophosphoesterase [Myxococcota bacterium]
KEALNWAAEAGLVCTDEWYLDPSPFSSREAWCAERLRQTEERLDTLPAEVPKVLVNHFPLRMDLVRLFKIPRFTLWCGTRKTEDWHRRWGTRVCVHGHLHMRATDWRNGVRFEEVAVGYPRHWVQAKGLDHYLREILPGPPQPTEDPVDPTWHR